MKSGIMLVVLSALALSASASFLPSPFGDFQLDTQHSVPAIQPPHVSLPGASADSLPVFVKPSVNIPDMAGFFGQKASDLDARFSSLGHKGVLSAGGRLDISEFIKTPKFASAAGGEPSPAKDIALIPSDNLGKIKSSATPGTWQNAWSGWQ